MVKLIATWGVGGGGKTTVALAVATALARNQKNVIVIGTDMETPCLPLYLPNQYPDNLTSLGRLSTLNISSINDLVNFIHLSPNSDRIGFMGLISEENITSYEPFEHSQVLNIINLLDTTDFHYVIWDLTSNPAENTLTMSALKISDYVLRIITPDVRGIEFEKSQLEWLAPIDRINPEEHIRVINSALPFSAVDATVSVIGKVDAVLPFSKGVYGRVISGSLIENTGDKDGIVFENSINKLVERIFAHERKQSK